MEHKWRKLTEEERHKLKHSYMNLVSMRRCENCGLMVNPGGGGIKAGHGTCEPIIVRKIMNE